MSTGQNVIVTNPLDSRHVHAVLRYIEDGTAYLMNAGTGQKMVAAADRVAPWAVGGCGC